jgi:hypothetical protein
MTHEPEGGGTAAATAVTASTSNRQQLTTKPTTTTTHVCSQVHFSLDFLKNSEILTHLTCPVTNCDEILSQKSALNFHLQKVHRIDLKVNLNRAKFFTLKL